MEWHHLGVFYYALDLWKQKYKIEDLSNHL